MAPFANEVTADLCRSLRVQLPLDRLVFNGDATRAVASSFHLGTVAQVCYQYPSLINGFDWSNSLLCRLRLALQLFLLHILNSFRTRETVQSLLMLAMLLS